jgi:hypothetical protein
MAPILLPAVIKTKLLQICKFELSLFRLTLFHFALLFLHPPLFRFSLDFLGGEIYRTCLIKNDHHFGKGDTAICDALLPKLISGEILVKDTQEFMETLT